MIDVYFDFTSDTPHFWEGFWERKDGLGLGATDPDSRSKTMREYHRIIWSKTLPCGKRMELECDGRHHYLKWNDFGFSSDSITASFRYFRNRGLLEEVAKQMPDYKAFVEHYLRKLYTIGGEMIYPEGRGNLNTTRGCNPRIKDRWDLTLECVRRHYAGEESPLTAVMERDRAFYDLFVDFRGYVDFFFFQDLVTDDYSQVKLWLDTPLFETNPIPKDVPTYLKWIQSQLDFVEMRNERIRDYLDTLAWIKKNNENIVIPECIKPEEYNDEKVYLGVFKGKQAFSEIAFSDNGSGRGYPFVYLYDGTNVDYVCTIDDRELLDFYFDKTNYEDVEEDE